MVREADPPLCIIVKFWLQTTKFWFQTDRQTDGRTDGRTDGQTDAIEDVERGAELSFSGPLRGVRFADPPSASSHRQILFSTNQIFRQNFLVWFQTGQTDRQTDRQTQ